MTISEEKKAKILELYNKGVSKKDIARLEGISYPSIRSILKEGDTEQIQERKKKIVEEKLIEIFRYEGYPEETIVNLVFNLKRIGEIFGRDLGNFVEDIEFVFDVYQKRTEKPIRMLDFLLDLSDNLTLIYDVVEPEGFLKAIEDYCKQATYLNDIETHIAEIKQKSNELVDSKAIELEDLDRQIEESRRVLIEIYGGYGTAIKKFVDNPKLKEANEKIAVLQLGNRILIEKYQNLKTKIKQNDKKNEIIKRENLAFKIYNKKLQTMYPEEANSVIEEIKNENDREKHPNKLKETIKEVDVKNDKQKTNTNKEESE